MNFVNPLAVQIGEHRKILFDREPARLEAAHLARRRSKTRGRLADSAFAHDIAAEEFSRNGP